MTRPLPAASSQISAVATCVVAAVIACAGGCRSAAHDDLYTDKLASEVRFLEDQLYQVDYENKVLRQKVERLRLAQSKASEPRRESVLGLPPRSEKESGDAGSLNNSGDSLEPPSIQTPDLKTPRVELGQPSIDSPDISPPDISLPDIEPGIALPPSESELIPPVIESGDILPPGDARSSPNLEPSRVVVPASFNEIVDEPVGLGYRQQACCQ